VLTWLALIALLAISAVSSHFNLGVGNLVIALTVATLKAALVALAFMKLGRSLGSVHLALLLTLLMLALLLSLSVGDAVRRGGVRQGLSPSAYELPMALGTIPV
jgi:cytochrome c oxidase subunit 4